MMKYGRRGELTVRHEGFLCHLPPLSRGGPLLWHLTAPERGEGGGRHPIVSLVPVSPLPRGLIPVP